MVDMYPLCAFGKSTVAASIDTPLHGFLPFRHIDHLHPDWGIALAASANGREKMEEFNRQFDHHLIWVPWQRPGFELAMMLRRAVQESPDCDGVVLGGHGLFTWGNTQQECYENTISIIDQLGQFVVGARREERRRAVRWSATSGAGESPRSCARYFSFPAWPSFGRAAIDRQLQRSSGSAALCEFRGGGTAWRIWARVVPITLFAPRFGRCLFPGSQARACRALREQIDSALKNYRKEYAEYYKSFALPDSPAMRDANPTVVLIPGIGMFSFGKSKTEARLTGEFYVNAIHVMEGATSMDTGRRLPNCRRPGRRRRPARSRCIRTTWRCLRRKHFGSNTGNWKKPRFAGSLRKKN